MEPWGRCQTQSSLPGECRGGEKHSAYGKPRVFHAACRREQQPPRHSLPFRFLSVPSGAFRGHDWGPSSLALRGLQPWAPGSPQFPPPGSYSTCGETQRREVGEDKCGQRGKARTLLGELKEGFLEESADDVHWN